VTEKSILVRAYGKGRGEIVGFYGIKRRRSGEEFFISGAINPKTNEPKEFSKKWMKRVIDHAEPCPDPPRANLMDGRGKDSGAEAEVEAADPEPDERAPVAISDVTTQEYNKSVEAAKITGGKPLKRPYKRRR